MEEKYMEIYDEEFEDNEEKELEENRKKYINEIEGIIRENEIFRDAKIIHGVNNNTIAFNKDGVVLTAIYGKTNFFVISKLKSIDFKPPQKDDFPQLYYCILGTHDPELPEVKILLSVNEPDVANKIYTEIEDEIKVFMDFN
jgi:hypothetical protein